MLAGGTLLQLKNHLWKRKKTLLLNQLRSRKTKLNEEEKSDALPEKLTEIGRRRRFIVKSTDRIVARKTKNHH